MSENEKQLIEELAEKLEKDCEKTSNSDCYGKSCSVCRAESVIKEGYRKQSEGHWIRWGQDSNKCSLCDKENTNCGWNYYCPYCGARMKGGAE